MFLKVLFLPVKCHYINISLLNLANVMYTLIIKLLLLLYLDIIISKTKGARYPSGFPLGLAIHVAIGESSKELAKPNL